VRRFLDLITLLVTRIKVHRHPDNPEMWFQLGRAYQERAKLHRPESLFLDMMSPDPAREVEEPDVVYVDPARLFYKKAIFAYRRAISLKPDYGQAWAHLGVAYTHRYRRGYSFIDDRLQEGLSEEKRRGLENAADAFQRAIQIEPNNALVWNDFAFVYGQLDRLDDEVNAYRQAVKIRPDFVQAWHNLTTVYYNRRQFDKVVQVCQEAVKHIPHDAHSWYDLGHANEELGRLEDAAEAYVQAWRLKADFPGPWVNLGVVYAKLGRVDDAVRVYSDVIKSKTKQKKHFYLARTSLEQNEQGQAVLRRLATLYPRFMAKQEWTK